MQGTLYKKPGTIHRRQHHHPILGTYPCGGGDGDGGDGDGGGGGGGGGGGDDGRVVCPDSCEHTAVPYFYVRKRKRTI